MHWVGGRHLIRRQAPIRSRRHRRQGRRPGPARGPGHGPAADARARLAAGLLHQGRKAARQGVELITSGEVRVVDLADASLLDLFLLYAEEFNKLIEPEKIRLRIVRVVSCWNSEKNGGT